VRYTDRAQAWASRLTDQLGERDVLHLATGLLGAVDEVATNRWEAAVERAAALPGEIRPERIKALTDQFAREVGAAGAVAGAVAVAPTFGTATTLLTMTAELAWFTARAGDLILTIAAIHGRPEPTVDERRAWVLAVLIYGSSARDELSRALNQASTGLAATTEHRLPLGTLQLANRAMSKVLFRRYGTRRGVAAFGRMIPLGLGAAIGGSVNWVTLRSLARNADQFFARLPYSAIDVDSTDITATRLAPSSPWRQG
jgi:hypothetical protein